MSKNGKKPNIDEQAAGETGPEALKLLAIAETRTTSHLGSRLRNYFLTGLIYSAREVRRAGDPVGMRYFQFQFRMTDARTNIIVWEKEYPVKREGTFR